MTSEDTKLRAECLAYLRGSDKFTSHLLQRLEDFGDDPQLGELSELYRKILEERIGLQAGLFRLMREMQ